MNLPPRGIGHWSVRPQRTTHYGHADLIAFIQDLAARAHAERLPALPIGDLSLPRGGPYPAQHRSHQSGLDVDIYFWRLDGGLIRPPLRSWQWAPVADPPREGPWRPGPLPNERIELLRLAAEDPRVDAVLVNPQIKAALCKRAQGQRQWLSRIQPFWGHERHFHIRLRCPADSPECVQNPLPTPQLQGDGCGDDLSWWFGPLAREAFFSLKRRDLHTRGRNLPSTCATVPELSRRNKKTVFNPKPL